jgi:hypothetical protein
VFESPGRQTRRGSRLNRIGIDSTDSSSEEKGEVAIEAGQQLLHYRLIEKIGEGGLGRLTQRRAGQTPRAALAAMDEDWDYFTESFAQFVVGWGNPNARKMAERFRTITSREELRALLEAFKKFDLAAVYAEIEPPTLVEHHPEYFFPDLYSRRIASMIPDCRMAVFSGSDGEFIIDLGIGGASSKR